MKAVKVSGKGKELSLKPTSSSAGTTLMVVAGILHRPVSEKLSDQQVATRITAKLRKADKASKSQ